MDKSLPRQQNGCCDRMNMLFQKMKLLFKSASVESICPVCENKDIKFLPLPAFYKEMAEQYGYERFGHGEMISLGEYSCSSCGSSDRERLYAYWIDKMMQNGSFNKGARLLHFAPELPLSRKLKKSGLFEYTTADLCMEEVDCLVDIMDLPFVDSSFDFFICSHVLEHVVDDDAAIKELYRITQKGGLGILVAPISIGLEKTIEDPTITSEEERWKNYGQADHLRLYAHDDFVRKIKSHGFEVKELGIDYFGERVFRELGMTNTSVLYIVKKT